LTHYRVCSSAAVVDVMMRSSAYSSSGSTPIVAVAVRIQ